MQFLTALFTAILCVIAGVLILLYVGSMIVIADSLSKIATAFTKWSERR